MAIVDITQYRDQANERNRAAMPAGQEPSLGVLQVAITGASAQSGAFAEGTTFVRVHADAACRVAIGANPVASSASQRMAANSTEYFGVVAGHKIAVITTA